jgi:ATP-dependent RNA helicase SUPV3L1/SUV3
MCNVVWNYLKGPGKVNTGLNHAHIYSYIKTCVYQKDSGLSLYHIPSSSLDFILKRHHSICVQKESTRWCCSFQDVVEDYRVTSSPTALIKMKKYPTHEWLKALDKFLSGPVSTQLIMKKEWPVSIGLERFRTYYEPLIHQDNAIQESLATIQQNPLAMETYFENALLTYLEEQNKDMPSISSIMSVINIRRPHSWYPIARQMRRKVVYHYGPTNSGKTHCAIEALKKAQSGVYCAPLRLLAAEIYERLNFEGVYCSLITGQERKIIPGARHYSMTVEMANIYLPESIDIAVIDEIQMIADPHRGYAWTEAILSLRVKEIHVCGNETAVDLVRHICTETGDDFETIAYSRLTKLVMNKQSLHGDLKHIKKGDCLIAFSRKQIFDIRHELESKTASRCCTVYGALPPEVRVMQARLFNDPESRYNVLIASDAVGMGLNL